MSNGTASPGPSNAMFNNATGVGIESGQFITSGHDTNLTFNNVQNNSTFNIFQGPDIFKYMNTSAKHFVASTNQSTNADRSEPEGYRMEADVSDIASSLDRSLFPVVSNADRYARSMLQCLYGYPLYEPRPFSESPEAYVRNGVSIGDVRFVREDGTFDVLFNICLPNGSVNTTNLSADFCLKTSEHLRTRPLAPHPRKTYIYHGSITRTSSGKYSCEGSEGAILELPEGAIQHEAVSILAFQNLAARNGVEWYKYTMAEGRAVPNGSLYLITSFTKCTQWGIAVFNRRCTSGQGLRFGSGAFATKVADPNQHDAPNQCVFLRGYKIMIRQDIFDNLRKDPRHRSNTAIASPSSQAKSSTTMHSTRQKASRIRGGAGTDPSLRSPLRNPLPRATNSAMAQTNKTVSRADSNSSLVHPSDFINAALLSQNPSAKVALTHDDVWCDLLRDNFPEFNHATLINIAGSYTNTVDEYGCVSLEKISFSSNESPVSPTLQPGPYQQLQEPAESSMSHPSCLQYDDSSQVGLINDDELQPSLSQEEAKEQFQGRAKSGIGSFIRAIWSCISTDVHFRDADKTSIRSNPQFTNMGMDHQYSIEMVQMDRSRRAGDKRKIEMSRRVGDKRKMETSRRVGDKRERGKKGKGKYRYQYI